MPRKKPRKQELAAINGTANAKRRREKEERLKLSIERAMLSAPKNRTQLTATLAQRDNTPDIPILSADVFLRGKVGNGCGEAGGGDAPCKHIQRQNQLIQPHALCADGV